MAILETKWFGVFLVDDKSNRVMDKRLMPKDADAAAEKLAEIQKGSILPEERELAEGRTKLAIGDSPNWGNPNCTTRPSSDLPITGSTMRSCTRSW